MLSRGVQIGWYMRYIPKTGYTEPADLVNFLTGSVLVNTGTTGTGTLASLLWFGKIPNHTELLL